MSRWLPVLVCCISGAGACYAIDLTPSLVGVLSELGWNEWGVIANVLLLGNLTAHLIVNRIVRRG